jgi:hypothetical protein
MARYAVTADGRSEVSNRDAYAITVRVHRDGSDLGLFQVWVSGIADLALERDTQTHLTKLQRRRLGAELLADIIESEARAGRLRDQWEIEVALFDFDPDAIRRRAVQLTRPPLDFADGDLIHEFDA